jgi:hypothetical protein
MARKSDCQDARISVTRTGILTGLANRLQAQNLGSRYACLSAHRGVAEKNALPIPTRGRRIAERRTDTRLRDHDVRPSGTLKSSTKATALTRRSGCACSAGIKWGVSGVDNRALGAPRRRRRVHLPTNAFWWPWLVNERAHALGVLVVGHSNAAACASVCLPVRLIAGAIPIHPPHTVAIARGARDAGRLA